MQLQKELLNAELRMPRLRPMALVFFALFASGIDTVFAGSEVQSPAEELVKFDARFLQAEDSIKIDISRFEKGNSAPPGIYKKSPLVLNGMPHGRMDVQLSENAQGVVLPCFDESMLRLMDIDPGKLPLDTDHAQRCAPIQDWVPGAAAKFSNEDQSLEVSLPQAFMLRTARGYVDPRFWDDGITAATLQYNTNIYQTRNSGVTDTQLYAGLSFGFNAGPWRLRHTGNATANGGDMRYQAVQTNLQRSVISLKSQLILGDGFTDGGVFDSFGLRGAQLVSDDRMLPESQRGYAPTIHGIAQTNAKVQILQNGNILYETTVAPGPFVINDLYPTGYGGDLKIRVTEADGGVHVSTTPYASTVNALRPGDSRFSLAAGEYRSADVSAKPLVAQATARYGMSNLLTVYGGAIAAQNYVSVAGGVAMNTPYGAVAADMTLADTRGMQTDNRQGSSLRLTYSTTISTTDTDIALAAYRYSTQGFLSLADAVALHELNKNGRSGDAMATPRGRLQATLNQNLGEQRGSLYFSGSAQDYWRNGKSDTQLSAGYNNTFRKMDYGVSVNRQLNTSTNRWENRVMVSLNVPLFAGTNSARSNTLVQHDSNGLGLQEAITGNAGENGVVGYGLNVGHDANGNSMSANTSYAARFGTLTASAGSSRNYTQLGAGLTGGAVVYGGGLLLAQALGSTVAVVEAKDAGGAEIIGGGVGARLNSAGKGVVTSLTAFGNNLVELDPKGLPTNVEMKSTGQQTAPTAGAVALVKFETEAIKGRSAILQATRADGATLPFGADVLDSAGLNIGAVAQGGRVIVRALATDQGTVMVKWGDGAGQSCNLTYSLPSISSSDQPGAYALGEATCK